MASYAEVAAQNSDQSPEEARAPPLPEIVPTEPVHVQTVDDVNHTGVTVIPAGFPNPAVKSEVQATSINVEHETDEDKGAEEEEENKKTKAKRATRKARDEIPNDPVELVNGLLVTAVLGFAGYGAYRKYAAGELNWKVAGIWAGGLAAFAVVDVVATRFLQDYRAKSDK